MTVCFHGILVKVKNLKQLNTSHFSWNEMAVWFDCVQKRACTIFSARAEMNCATSAMEIFSESRRLFKHKLSCCRIESQTIEPSSVQDNVFLIFCSVFYIEKYFEYIYIYIHVYLYMSTYADM